MESSDSELRLVQAAKAQHAGAKRTPPRPLPPAAAAAPAAPAPQPDSSDSSDSEEGFDLIAAAKKQQRSGAAAQATSPRHLHAASASPPAAGGSLIERVQRPTRSTPPPAGAPTGSSDSDSDGQDMVTLARQHGRQANTAVAAAAYHAGSISHSPRPSTGAAVGATRRELNHSISLAPAVADVGGAAAVPPMSPAAAAQQHPAHVPQQPSRTGTVAVHEGVPVPAALLELAAGELPQLPEAGQESDGQAAHLPGQPFAFSASHSRQASSLQAATPHSPRAASQYAAAGSSRSPSRLATTQAGPGEGSSAVGSHAQAAGGSSAPPAPSSRGVPLASLADLGDVLGSVVGELKSSLRWAGRCSLSCVGGCRVGLGWKLPRNWGACSQLESMVQSSLWPSLDNMAVHPPCSADIGRLEAGWAQRWCEQADSTAQLCGRLDAMAAASDGRAQEVAGRLQVGEGGSLVSSLCGSLQNVLGSRASASGEVWLIGKHTQVLHRPSACPRPCKASWPSSVAGWRQWSSALLQQLTHLASRTRSTSPSWPTLAALAPAQHAPRVCSPSCGG